jgi:hypothetical protein
MILKNILFTLTTVALLQSAYAQQKLAGRPFQKAKTADNSGYILIVNQDTVKWKDTVYYYASKLRSCRYARIPVTLTNISADTLKYMDMSCSTLAIFTTDTRDARIIQNQLCYKNGPAIFKLAPYASVTFELPICFSSTNARPSQILTTKEFKIGMGLFAYNGKISVSDDYPGMMAKKSENIIWSKAIIVR